MTENTEVVRLREQVAQLEAELAARPAVTPRTRDRHFWRSLVSATLIVLSCVLAPLSVTAVWANRQISDTNRYVETVAPLANDPGVQAAVANQVTKAVLDKIDVPSLTADVVDGLANQNLPPRAVTALRALQVPITNGIESFIRSSVSKIVASDQFATAWVAANRAAHTQVVTLLEGKQGGALTAQNDQITLNLAPIIAQVRQNLIDNGYSAAEKIPTVNKSFVLVTSSAVTKAQSFYGTLNTLGYWLPIVTLLLLGLGVYTARGHRRALIAGSLGFVGGMLVIGIGLAIARVFYLNAVPSDVLPRDVAGTIFDTLVRFLRTALRAVAVLGLVVAVGAFFTGPSTTAVNTRRTLSRGIGGVRETAESHGVQTGAFGRWTFAHKHAIWVGLVILGGFTLTFWSQPTAGVVVGTALVVLVLAGIVELVSRPPGVTEPAVEGGDGTGPSVPSGRTTSEGSDATDTTKVGVP